MRRLPISLANALSCTYAMDSLFELEALFSDCASAAGFSYASIGSWSWSDLSTSSLPLSFECYVFCYDSLWT